MIGLVILGGLALMLLIPAVSALLSIYNAFWAAKIWALLVVPVFHFPPLPLAGAVGLALTMAALRQLPRPPTDKDESLATVFIREVVIGLLIGPCIYLVALIAGRVLL